MIMKKFLKVLWYIFLGILVFVVLVFIIVWVSTKWVDERANDVISQIQAWNIEQLYNEIHNLEVEANVANQLSLEQFQNAIVLPNGLADLRTIHDVSWNWRWFENNIKYIEWDWILWNGIKIHLRLEFLEKDWEYKFYWIVWNQVQ